MVDFYDSNPAKALLSKVRLVTQETSLHKKETAFKNATMQGSVTLMIREFGRGTDFVCYNDLRVTKAGGIHVLQTFFSSDVSEEVQIKGRMARQGEPGSYSMVLRANDLVQQLHVSIDELKTEDTRGNAYSFLDRRRKKLQKKPPPVDPTRLKKAAAMHYRTFAFRDALIKERDREGVVNFICELSGTQIKPSFVDYRKYKRHLLRKSQERIFNHYLSRQAKSPQYLEAEQDEFIDVDRFSSGSATHYDVLQVEQTADRMSVLASFRRLVLIYHPDKCKRESAASIFRRIKEARDVLLHPVRRIEYDQKTFMSDD